MSLFVCLFLSLCTFFSHRSQLVWSNFEIADMDFWRSEAYMKFFEYLESLGGFYYEVCIRYFHFVLCV